MGLCIALIYFYSLFCLYGFLFFFFFFQAEDGIRDHCVTGVQTCALPICENVLESIQTIAEDAFFGAIEITSIKEDRKSTRLNSSHTVISYAVFCLKKKKSPH